MKIPLFSFSNKYIENCVYVQQVYEMRKLISVCGLSIFSQASRTITVSIKCFGCVLYIVSMYQAIYNILFSYILLLVHIYIYIYLLYLTFSAFYFHIFSILIFLFQFYLKFAEWNGKLYGSFGLFIFCSV